MAPGIVLRRCGTCTRKNARIARLKAELANAYHDPIWDIETRQGIERRMPHLRTSYVAIVIDLDCMHDRNREFGHAGVDWRITRIFQHVRRDDSYAGRWLRGDEIVMFVHQNDAEGLAIRLLVTFEMYGMSATMLIAPASYEGIASGIAAIDAAKDAGRRGQILEATV